MVELVANAVQITNQCFAILVEQYLITLQVMSLFEAAFEPAGLAELKAHYDEGRTLVLAGPENKFDGLVTLQEIEKRLNDGCNASNFAQVISSGERRTLVDSNTLWSPAAMRKAEYAQAMQRGLSIMLTNSSQITRAMAVFIDELEQFFANDNVQADVHLYVSTQAGSNSYNAHRDIPQHKILLQTEGDVEWQIFEPKQALPDNVRAISPEEQEDKLQLVSEFTLTKGDLLYMPPGVFHRVVKVNKPRVSISIPFFSAPNASTMDRSYIPLISLFEDGADA